MRVSHERYGSLFPQCMSFVMHFSSVNDGKWNTAQDILQGGGGKTKPVDRAGVQIKWEGVIQFIYSMDEMDIIKWNLWSMHVLKVLDQITFLTTRLTSTFLRFWYQKMAHIFHSHHEIWHSNSGYLRRNNKKRVK